MLGFELVSAIILIVVAAGICIIAFQVPLSLAPHFWAGAGMFPFILGALLVFLSACWALDVTKKRREQQQSEQPPAEKHQSAVDEILGPPDRRRRLYIISILTLVFVFVLIPVFGAISNDYGFMGTTFVFTVAGLKCFSTLSLKTIALVSACTAVCVYFIFTYGLSLPMPR